MTVPYSFEAETQEQGQIIDSEIITFKIESEEQTQVTETEAQYDGSDVGDNQNIIEKEDEASTFSVESISQEPSTEENKLPSLTIDKDEQGIIEEGGAQE